MQDASSERQRRTIEGDLRRVQSDPIKTRRGGPPSCLAAIQIPPILNWKRIFALRSNSCISVKKSAQSPPPRANQGTLLESKTQAFERHFLPWDTSKADDNAGKKLIATARERTCL